MSSLSYGTKYTFNAAACDYVVSCQLSSTSFVVAYRDAGASNRGTAVVGTISGGVITFGSEFQFTTNAVTHISIAKISSTSFAISYTDTSAGDVKLILGSVSGTTISYGTASQVTSDAGTRTQVGCLDSTHIAVAWRASVGSSSVGTSVIAVVSGTTVSSYGSAQTFNAATTDMLNGYNMAVLDSTHYVITYTDGGNSSFGTGIVGVVSAGTTITFGSEYVFNSASSIRTGVATIDSTHVLVIYRDSDNTGKALIGTIASGNQLSYGSAYTFETDAVLALAPCVLDSTHIAIAWKDGDNNTGSSIVGEISGTAISYSSIVNFETDEPTALGNGICPLTSTTFVVSYSDNAGTYGKSVIGTGTFASVVNSNFLMFMPN